MSILSPVLVLSAPVMASDLPIAATRIGACLSFHAGLAPDREAAVDRRTRLSYAELSREVTRWSKALLAAGIGKGDRVAMLTPPCNEWLTVMLAVTDIGAVWVGYHPRYRQPEFDHVTQLAEPKLLIAFRHIDERDYSAELSTLVTKFNFIESAVVLDDEPGVATASGTFLTGADHVSDDSLTAARDAVHEDDTAVVIFTSGTTGAPKGAMIKHRALLTGARVENEHWPMTRPRLLHMMPVNHIAGVGMVGVFGLYVGGTLVFQDRFEPGELLRLLESERIQHVLGSPVQFHLMANHPELAGRNLQRLEFITWGGAPMAARLVEQLAELPGRLCTAYGMTELGLYVTYSDPRESGEALSTTIGRAHHGFDIRVADEVGVETPVGEQGEIQARGDWLLAGYYRDPEATREAFTEDGWFRTGDVAKVRADGNLEIVGRTKEMYISGGFNIYPREIEIAIESHPKVGLVAVLGVTDEMFGEVGYAFVEAKSGQPLDPREVDTWCRERLANYKIPKHWSIDPELPRLPIGKIDKQTLRRRLPSDLQEPRNGRP